MLRPLEKIVYQPPQSGKKYALQFNGQDGVLSGEDFENLFLPVRRHGHHIFLDGRALMRDDADGLLAVTLDYFFAHFREVLGITVEGFKPAHLSPWREFFDPTKMEISRACFYQIPSAWHYRGLYQPGAESWTATDGRRHPARPAAHRGCHYRRYVPSIGKTIALRTVDVKKDLDLFHEWNNQARVYDLWELNKTKPELQAYLEKGLGDPHQIPLIIEFNGEPAGYMEVYWAPEDRLGPYYDHQPYDRGFHFLIGDSSMLGAKNTKAVITSILHYIFLDEARTRRAVAEPRADNRRVIRYTEMIPGWRVLDEFDFPHKRAVLLMSIREDFFEGAL